MPERCTYIARSTAIAARALAGEMMVMNSTDSTFFTLNEVATAIRKRLAALAPARLTGERPGILSIFVEDTDRLEWAAYARSVAPLPGRAIFESDPPLVPVAGADAG